MECDVTKRPAENVKMLHLTSSVKEDILVLQSFYNDLSLPVVLKRAGMLLELANWFCAKLLGQLPFQATKFQESSLFNLLDYRYLNVKEGFCVKRQLQRI